MNYDEIVFDICDRLNLTSPEAQTRIGREVNRYYRRIRTSLGLREFSQEPGIVAATTIGSDTVVFETTQKVQRVYDDTTGRVRLLEQITWDEMREHTPRAGGTPTQWAIESQDADSVTVRLDVVMSVVQNLKADGTSITGDLADDDVPAFPEDFHDILIEGVLSDEYLKREKTDLARIAKTEYETRLSDLRMWVIKSAYLTWRQGELPTAGFRRYTYRS